MRNRPPTNSETIDFQPGDVLHQIRSTGNVEAFWMLGEDDRASKLMIRNDGEIAAFSKRFIPGFQTKLEKMMVEIYALRDRYLVEGIVEGVGEEVDRILALGDFDLADEVRAVCRADLLGVVVDGDMLAERFPDDSLKKCGNRYLDSTYSPETRRDISMELAKKLVNHVRKEYSYESGEPLDGQQQIELKEFLLFINELFVNSKNVYGIADGFNMLGLDDELKRYGRGFVYSNEYDYHIPPEIYRTFTEEEMEIYISRYLKYHDGDCDGDDFETVLKDSFVDGLVKDRLRGNLGSFLDYAGQVGLPLESMNTEIRPDMINAAGELISQYDLIVGVMNAGCSMAALCELMGGNVRYIEWHQKDREWENREPVWRNVGMNFKPVTEAKRILVCENDAVTGTTLRKIIPALQALGSEAVDVCFFLEAKGNKVAGDIPFYRQHFGTWNVPSQNFLEHVGKFEKVLSGPQGVLAA